MSGLGVEKTALAARLRREGLTNAEIAAKLGVRHDNVCAALGRGLGGNQVYNEADRARVRELRWEGKSMRAIAKETGIPFGTVAQWINPRRR